MRRHQEVQHPEVRQQAPRGCEVPKRATRGTTSAARDKARDIRALARNRGDPHFDQKSPRLKAELGGHQLATGTVAEFPQRYLESREAKSWRPATRDTLESC